MSECQCEECKNACRYNPGWFTPGQAEKAAEHLGMTLQAFFAKYLGVNWWEGSGEYNEEEDIFVLAPAIVGAETGYEYPGDPRGRCVFFVDGLCSIHAVKPFECAEFIHGEEHNKSHDRHHDIAVEWKEHQDQIVELLGREPETSPFGFFDALFGNW